MRRFSGYTGACRRQTPLGGEVRVEQEHQMHQMSIYSGVYTEETLPLKPIVSEVRGGGVSEESDGCLGVLH